MPIHDKKIKSKRINQEQAIFTRNNISVSNYSSETKKHQRLQETVNNSPQVQKARQFQLAANNSPQVWKARNWANVMNGRTSEENPVQKFNENQPRCNPPRILVKQNLQMENMI